MKINELIKTRGKSISFEFFPPKTLLGEEKLQALIKQLGSFSPSFVSVTQHAGPNTLERTRNIVMKIAGELGNIVMPHITCADPPKDDLASIISNYRELGIENILALRGDRQESGVNIFNGHTHFRHAADLVKFIRGYHNFCIGVAVYPENHPESLNSETETAYTKYKIDQGADFAISQMFFENSYFYAMLDRFSGNGIDIPIIPGIMPITDFGQVIRFAKLGHVSIPERIADIFESVSTPEDALKTGIDLCVEQCLDLWKNGVRLFHFYTLNKGTAAVKILDNLGSAIVL